jgi:hypothetical protein
MWTRVKFFFPVICIFFLTFPLIGEPISTGVDYSYYAAYNYFFIQGLSHYHAIFSYGPLGFLFFPEPLGNNIALGLVFWGVIHLIFVIQLFLLSNTNQLVGGRIMNIVLIFLLCNFIDPWYTPIFSLALALLLYRQRGKQMWLIYAAVLFAVTSLIKVTYLATGILTYGGVTLAEYMCRGVWPSTRRGVWVCLLAGSILIYMLWIVLVGPQGFGDFLRGYWEITKGDSGIMALSPQNNWWLLSGFIVLFFVSGFWEKKQWFLSIFFLPVLFSMWKYTFTREDPTHLRYFFDFLVLFYGIMILEGVRETRRSASLRAGGRRWIGNSVMICSVLVLGWHMQTIPEMGNPRFLRETVKKIIVPAKRGNFHRTVVDYGSYKIYLRQESEKKLATDVLSAHVRTIIGQSPVDVYPWEASIVVANNLHWQYRPVFQSYVSFTPWLDDQKAAFLDSAAAPQFILWQKHDLEDAYRTMSDQSIDGRYLLNDEPNTMRALFGRYTMISQDMRVIVWEKQPSKHERMIDIYPTGIISWGERITLPESTQSKTRIMHITIRRTLLQEIKKVLWKEEPLYVTYILKDGKEIRYRIGLENMRNGVWISADVQSVRFIKDPNDQFDLRIL